MALSDRAETVNLHSSQRDTTIDGICFPCLAFTALHTGWHAHEYFLKEKIQLRHMIDWAVALRQHSGEDAEAVNAVNGNTLWDRLLDSLTAIALHRLGLPKEWFLQQDVEAVKAITPDQEQKVWNDIMAASRTTKCITTTNRRLQITKRMLRNRRKFNAYANIIAERFVWEEFVGHFRS